MTPQKVKEILSKHFQDIGLTDDALRCIASSINKSIREQASPPSSDVPDGWIELTDKQKTGQWISGAKFYHHAAWIYNEQETGGAFASSGCRIIIPVSKTFESHGIVWTRHKPGDPMPCKDDDFICCITEDDNDIKLYADEVNWGDDFPDNGRVVGWCYADKKIVKLGPSDIPPNSIIRFKSHTDGTYYTPTSVSGKNDGVYFCDTSVFHKSYDALMKDCEINRPKHRDADGYPTLWEPCSKEEA